MPRFHCSTPLAANTSLALPAGAARHVQVLRLQPGDAITLFDGLGGEYAATVERMGRSEVTVDVGAHDPVEREASRSVHLAMGMPANERMDWLIEKATELGAASFQPLMTAHGVLRLSGERADKKTAHWQAVAISACEQCGRNRVPVVHPIVAVNAWLASLGTADAAANGRGARLLLGFGADAQAIDFAVSAATADASFTLLSGPEGGLDANEQRAAATHGFVMTTLGPRVLRAETAPLAALMALTS
ncbi:MAG: 16S rRNA (uracil(1498)-N(3))-methyltransferase [Burkholderiaceae bacterium]